MPRAALLLLLPLLLCCGRKTTCPPEPLYPVLTGYAASEADTLWVVRYAHGSQFTNAHDSTLLTLQNRYFRRSNDSTYIVVNNNRELLSGEWDFRLINPFDGRSISISDVLHETATQRRGLFSMDPQPCASPLTSYRRDGQLVSLPAEYPRMQPVFVYLSR